MKVVGVNYDRKMIEVEEEDGRRILLNENEASRLHSGLGDALAGLAFEETIQMAQETSR